MVEDVELCLEIQVDPDSKRILSNPEKCRSTLLDVTVLKPKEMEAFGTQITNTLTAAEVRKLISSLEKQRRKKQKVLDKLKYDDTIIKVRKHEDMTSPRKTCPKRKEKAAPADDLERKDFIGITESVEPLFCEIRRSLKNVETRITSMQDINLVISQTTVDESAAEEFVTSRRKRRHTPFTTYSNLKNPSVYRVETTPRDLKSVLVCGDKHKVHEHGEKVQGKCMCENCGIIGLLMECQKHRFMSELNASPTPSSHFRKVRNKRTKTRFQVSNYDSLQPKVVEEAYVMQLTDRVKLLEHRLAEQEEKIIPKEYFKKVISKVVTNFSPMKSTSIASLTCSERDQKKKDARSKSKGENSKDVEKTIRTDKATITEEDLNSCEYNWKWGEEILKPGIDLKNRIVTLLNDILSKFALREKCPIENVSDKKDEFNSDTFKKFMDHINTKMFVGRVETNEKTLPYQNNKPSYDYKVDQNDYPRPVRTARKESVVLQGKMKTPREPEAKKMNVKNVDISYVNPKISQWQKDSHSLFKGREEFLKIVAKAKQYQKDVLWRNIWSQAKANSQNKGDKLTIKIPVQSKGDKAKKEMLETEMTIGEVEMILRGRY